MKSTSEILTFLEKNKEFFHQHFRVEKIGIFGSFARNEQTEDSDIDILVQFSDDTPDLFDMRIELKEYIENNLGHRVDVCYQAAIKPVFREMILTEAIYV